MRKLVILLTLGFVVALLGCSKSDDGTGGNGNNGDTTVVGDDTLRTVSLDHVGGSPAAGEITSGGEVVFYIRLKNDATDKAKGITNGFRIYSPNGATWNTTVGDTTGTLGKGDFDLIFAISGAAIDGAGEDTVGFGGAVTTGPGLAPGFDDIAYAITIGPIDAGSVGKSICIDSCYYRPSGTWAWAFGEPSGTFSPGWDGPHCFTVK